MEKAREFEKNIHFYLIYDAKTFVCVDHNKLWKTLKEMGISDHLTCLLRYAEDTPVCRSTTLYGKADWFTIEKGV